jgi:hypothetical protein
MRHPLVIGGKAIQNIHRIRSFLRAPMLGIAFWGKGEIKRGPRDLAIAVEEDDDQEPRTETADRNDQHFMFNVRHSSLLLIILPKPLSHRIQKQTKFTMTFFRRRWLFVALLFVVVLLFLSVQGPQKVRRDDFLERQHAQAGANQSKEEEHQNGNSTRQMHIGGSNNGVQNGQFCGTVGERMANKRKILSRNNLPGSLQ